MFTLRNCDNVRFGWFKIDGFKQLRLNIGLLVRDGVKGTLCDV
jgi:hypothetical protein